MAAGISRRDLARRARDVGQGGAPLRKFWPNNGQAATVIYSDMDGTDTTDHLGVDDRKA